MCQLVLGARIRCKYTSVNNKFKTMSESESDFSISGSEYKNGCDDEETSSSVDTLPVQKGKKFIKMFKFSVNVIGLYGFRKKACAQSERVEKERS